MLFFCYYLVLARIFISLFIFKIALWQRDINQLMSDYLHQIQTDKTHAGMWLIAISFYMACFMLSVRGMASLLLRPIYLLTKRSSKRA